MSIRVLVTGANRGIGYNTIERLLFHAGEEVSKYHVILTSRDTKKGEEAAMSLISKYPGAKIQVVPLDLRNKESILSLAELLKIEGAVDILVNNIGINLEAGGSALPYSHENVRAVMEVNYFNTKFFTETLLERDLIEPSGIIINVGSEVGRFGELGTKHPEVYERLAHFSSNGITVEELDKIAERFVDEVKEEGTREKWGMKYMVVYGRSKTFLQVYTYILGHFPKVLQNQIQVYSVSPGWCKTDLGGPEAFLTASEGGDRIASSLTFRKSFDPQVQGLFIADRKIKSMEGSFGSD